MPDRAIAVLINTCMRWPRHTCWTALHLNHVTSHKTALLPLMRAVAMAHLPDSSAGYVSGLNFFIYKFDRQQVCVPVG